MEDRVVLKEIDSSRGVVVFGWTPKYGSFAVDDVLLDPIPVSPLLIGPDGERTIWIALGFRLRAPDLVDAVNLRLYHGGFAADSKRLLIRGEWDLYSDAKSRAIGHAQPHWHFHVEVGGEPEPLSALFGELRKEDVADEDVSPLEGLAVALRYNLAATSEEESGIPVEDAVAGNETVHGVHFPMVSNWDAMPLRCISDHTDEGAIYRWLEALTIYIRGEFKSIYGLP